ncbi:RNA-directed DNA polymerase, eukaryota [Tanacetum coccineum]
MDRGLAGIDNFGFAQSNAIGRSGGLLLIWDSNVFSNVSVVGGERFIAAKGNWKGVDGDVMLVNAYGAHVTDQKMALWDRTSALMNTVAGGWCLFGDFNEVKEPDDGLNTEFNARDADNFNEFIRLNSLVEIQLGGRKYTRISDDGYGLRLSNGPKSISECFDFVAQKWFKNVKEALKRWSRIKFGGTKQQIEVCRNEAMKWEKEAEARNLNDDELEFWMKARIEWVDKENEMVTRGNNRPRFINDRVPKLSVDNVASLELPFSEKEVWDAVCNCGGNKAPGPDGFNFKYIKRFWDIIKGGVLTEVRWFWDKGEISNGVMPLLLSLSRRPWSSLKKKRKGLIFKVDFEKAYDSIEWGYLIEIMERMGFGVKWCKWVTACLKSSSISVHVNGSPTKEFMMERGVRQGDPLSPFLFILAAEGLNALLNDAVDKDILRGVRVGEDDLMVSHLQYADDTIIFGEWSRENTSNLMNVLKCFKEVAGLKINLNKSKIYDVGVERGELDTMAHFMRCSVGEVPFTYLGLPVGVNMRRVSAWNEVIERFKSRLSEWKAKAMSFGGRLTLVKSVLGSLPLYYFSMFRVPSNVINALERNLALVGKWWWRFRIESDSHWCRVIKSIYGDDRGWGVEGRSRLKGGGVWSDIVRVDKWVGEVIGSVGNMGVELVLIRTPRGKEWKCELIQGEFSVKSLSEWIERRHVRREAGITKLEWNTLVPRKVNVFIWRALNGRIPVRNDLDKKGIDLDSILCPCCENVLESVDHCLVTCEKALYIWERMYAWWGIAVVDVFTIKDILQHSGGRSLGKEADALWHAVVILLLNGDGDVRSMLDEAFLPKMEVPTRWIKSIPIKFETMAKYHAVVMANPAQGHVIPAMELAQRIVIKVTFVNTEAIHQKVVTSTWLEKNGHNSLLQMVSIPDELEPWSEDRNDWGKLAKSMLQSMP